MTPLPVQLTLNSTAGPVLADPTVTLSTSGTNLLAAIVVPAVSRGVYTLIGWQPITGSNSVFSGATEGNGDLTIHPSMRFQPASGAAGQTITTGLFSFAPGSQITLHWDSATGTVLSSTTTDATGQAIASFTVPSTATGAHSIYATGPGGVIRVGFQVTSAPTTPPSTMGDLTPAAAAPSAFVRFDATGFSAGEVVVTQVNGTPVDNATASNSGSVEVPLIVPAAVNGASLAVLATGLQSGRTVAQVLNVNARLVLVPSSGLPGSEAIGAAFGLPAKTPLALYWDTTSGPPLATSTSDALGSAALSFTVPANAATGKHAVVVVAGTTAKAAFTVK